MWSLEFCLFSRKIKHLSEGDDLLLYMWHTMSTSFLSFSDSASSEANIRHCLRGEQWETIEFLFSEMCTVNLKHARICHCCKKNSSSFSCDSQILLLWSVIFAPQIWIVRPQSSCLQKNAGSNCWYDACRRRFVFHILARDRTCFLYASNLWV